MNIELHKATETEIPELSRILNQARRFKDTVGDPIWGKYDFDYDETKQILDRSDTYLATIDGKSAGCVSLQWNDERIWGDKGNDNLAVYIHKLSVSDEFRGQDVGSLIINSCAEIASQHGRELLRLDCSKDNEGLCKYYESLGFSVVGEMTIDSGYSPNLYQRPIDLPTSN